MFVCFPDIRHHSGGKGEEKHKSVGLNAQPFLPPLGPVVPASCNSSARQISHLCKVSCK